MFHNASEQAFKPKPQPSTSGTHVSAVLSSLGKSDLIYSEEALLMLTHSTFTLKVEQIFLVIFILNVLVNFRNATPNYEGKNLHPKNHLSSCVDERSDTGMKITSHSEM